MYTMVCMFMNAYISGHLFMNIMYIYCMHEYICAYIFIYAHL
jgi:hypothetical protein